MEEDIKELEDYAHLRGIPIMEKDGIIYLTNFLKKNSIKSVLEVGTAIGYSAIQMALAVPDLKVVTIERDEERYLEAVKNIKKFHLEDRITLIFNDAFNVSLSDKFDLIFLDAAKAQNIRFFERFEKNLKPKGVFITDNMHFHGLVQEEDTSKMSRSVRGIVRKIREYITFLEENEDYKTEFISIGDGLAISWKK